jgi:hypothetical protein
LYLLQWLSGCWLPWQAVDLEGYSSAVEQKMGAQQKQKQKQKKTHQHTEVSLAMNNVKLKLRTQLV